MLRKQTDGYSEKSESEIHGTELVYGYSQNTTLGVEVTEHIKVHYQFILCLCKHIKKFYILERYFGMCIQDS